MADGTVRDVTPICYYNSSNPEIADVDADGHVVFKTRGEVAVIAHYLDLVANVRLTHLVEVPGFQVAEVPAGQRDRPGGLRQAEPDADQPVRAVHRRGVHPPGLPRRDRRPAHARRRSRRSWPTPPPDRRAKLVDRLLDRPEFYDFWTLKFADILRSNGRLIQTKGTYVFNRWIRDAASSGTCRWTSSSASC